MTDDAPSRDPCQPRTRRVGAMSDDRVTAAAHRVLLGALAVRESLELGPLRFKTLASMVAPHLDADTVARLLSEWETLGFIVGDSSLQDGLPEPVYRITKLGRAKWDRMRGQP